MAFDDELLYSSGKKSLIRNVFPHNGLVIESFCSVSSSESSLEKAAGFNMTNLQAEGTMDVKYFIPRTWPEVDEQLEDL